MPGYAPEVDDDAEDRGHDDAVQRADDLLEDVRQASGTSPEVLALKEARRLGREAGRKGYGPEMCEYAFATPERAVWEAARVNEMGALVNAGLRGRIS